MSVLLPHCAHFDFSYPNVFLLSSSEVNKYLNCSSVSIGFNFNYYEYKNEDIGPETITGSTSGVVSIPISVDPCFWNASVQTALINFETTYSSESDSYNINNSFYINFYLQFGLLDNKIYGQYGGGVYFGPIEAPQGYHTAAGINCGGGYPENRSIVVDSHSLNTSGCWYGTWPGRPEYLNNSSESVTITIS